MTQMMEARRIIIGLVKRYELAIRLIVKFCVGLYVFAAINGTALYGAQAARLFTGGTAVLTLLFLALMFAIAPPTLAYGLMAADMVLQTSGAIEIAVIVAVVCLLVIIFYVRLAPKTCWLLLATVVAFHFKLPYAVVLFAGLYVGASAVAPVAIGTWVSFVMPGMLALARGAGVSAKGFDVAQLQETAVGAIDGATAALVGQTHWVVFAFIFAVVILGMWAVQYAPIDYAKEIALGFGALACVVSFVVAAVVVDGFTSPLSALLGTVASAAIVVVIRLFDSLPDYGRAERVRFEDDQYMYSVKIVPKK